MTRVIIFLSLQLLIAYTALSMADREYLSTLPACERVFRVCVQQLENEWSRLEELSEFRQLMGNRTQLARLVETMQVASDCRDRAVGMPGCENNRFLRDHQFYPVVTDFLQTPGTIDNIVATSTSDCLASEMNLYALGRAASQCAMGAQTAIDNGDVCRGIGNFLSCAERTVRERCGQAAGQLTRRIRQYVFSRPELNDLAGEYFGVDVSSCQNLASVSRRSADQPRSLFNRFRK